MRGREIPFDEALAAEAADWYARLRSENLSEIDAARFRTWLAGDPARRREFEAISGFWDELAVLEDTPEVLEARKSIAARRAGSAEQMPAALSTRRRGVISMGWWASAAAMMLAAVAVWFVAPLGSDPNRYATGVGEQRTVPLADGSVVTLNTATEILLHYSARARAVELVSGQANFEVAKDAARPFVVSAGGGSVRAVGTVFDVYRSGNQVKVTLIEGKVAVRPGPTAIVAGRDAAVPRLPVAQSGQGPSSTAGLSSSPGLPSNQSPESSQPKSVPTPAALPAGLGIGEGEIMLVAGEQLVYGGAGPAPQPVATDLQRVTAWHARKLDFSDTPLDEAIAEANRYSPDQIVLQAPGLENARISGSFEAGKNEAFAEGLQSYFRLNVEHRADRSIVLTPRD